LLRRLDGVFRAIADGLKMTDRNWHVQGVLARRSVLTLLVLIFVSFVCCVFQGPPSPFATESYCFPVSHTSQSKHKFPGLDLFRFQFTEPVLCTIRSTSLHPHARRDCYCHNSDL
jgi:hypothetical protein